MTNDKDLIIKKDKKLLMFLMFIPCLFFEKSLNNDIWFLLNSGRYVINYGIPYVEPFTIHTNMEFIMQQWLTSTVYWIIYKNFGEYGLYFIVISCYGLAIFMMYKLTTLVSNNNFFVSFILTMLFGVYTKTFMVTRPIVFTTLILMIELYSLEAYITYNNKKYLIILPILSLLLINLQAAMWPILFIFLAPYIIDSFHINLFKFSFGQGYEKKYLFITIILMILIAFINPYGIKSITYLYNSYGYSEISDTVLEMLPPNINNATGMTIFSLIFIVALIYLFNKNGKSKVRYILLTIGTCVMVLSSVRNFSFFVICAVFPMAYSLKDINYNFKNDKSSPKMLKLRIALLISIIILLFYLLFVRQDDTNKDEGFSDLFDTVDYLLEVEEAKEVVLYTGYNDGGYTEFNGLASYIDPRAEVFVKKNNKKDDIMKEYIDLQGGKLYYKSVLDKYNFTHLLVSDGDILNTYLPYDNNYDIIYSNESYKIFKKID